MQENTQQTLQNESSSVQANQPAPVRENAFQYPASQKTSSQFSPERQKINLPRFILLMIIFLLGLAIVLWKFVFGSNVDFLNAFRALPSPTPTVAVVSTATPTVDLTATSSAAFANWKTYKNEKYGFEIRYPESWNLTLSSGNSENFSQNNLIDVRSPDYKADHGVISGGNLLITVTKKNNNETLETFINSNSVNPNGLYLAEKYDFHGMNAYLFKPKLGLGSIDGKFRQIHFDKNGVFISIVYQPADIKNDNNSIVIDQILATFKFTAVNSNITITPIATQSGMGK